MLAVNGSKEFALVHKGHFSGKLGGYGPTANDRYKAWCFCLKERQADAV